MSAPLMWLMAVALLLPVDLLSQTIPSETGPKSILTIHATAGWEYTLLKYSSFTNEYGTHYDYLPWHVYLAQTNGDVDVIDLKSGPNSFRYASRSTRIWNSGSPYRQPQMTGRQGFVVTSECQTNFTYLVKTNASIGSTNWVLWRTHIPATNGTVRFIDENYASVWGQPWIEGTADTSRFYLLEVRSGPVP